MRTREELIEEINSRLELHDYPFRNREDFTEDRFPWDEVSEAANDFYYMLLEVKDFLDEQ